MRAAALAIAAAGLALGALPVLPHVEDMGPPQERRCLGRAGPLWRRPEPAGNRQDASAQRRRRGF